MPLVCACQVSPTANVLSLFLRFVLCKTDKSVYSRLLFFEQSGFDSFVEVYQTRFAPLSECHVEPTSPLSWPEHEDVNVLDNTRIHYFIPKLAPTDPTYSPGMVMFTDLDFCSTIVTLRLVLGSDNDLLTLPPEVEALICAHFPPAFEATRPFPQPVRPDSPVDHRLQVSRLQRTHSVEIEQLNEQIEELTIQANQREGAEEVDVGEDEVAAMRTALAEKAVALSKSLAEVVELKAENEKLQTALDREKRKYAQLDEALDECFEELEREEKENSLLKADIAGLQTDLARSQSTLEVERTTTLQLKTQLVAALKEAGASSPPVASQKRLSQDTESADAPPRSRQRLDPLMPDQSNGEAVSDMLLEVDDAKLPPPAHGKTPSAEQPSADAARPSASSGGAEDADVMVVRERAVLTAAAAPAPDSDPPAPPPAQHVRVTDPKAPGWVPGDYYNQLGDWSRFDLSSISNKVHCGFYKVSPVKIKRLGFQAVEDCADKYAGRPDVVVYVTRDGTRLQNRIARVRVWATRLETGKAVLKEIGNVLY
ncbi:hypothetical protein JCM10207_004866 [Rhodosporidiobolus poonsookiae]